MQSLRHCLPREFLKRLEGELGREEALRLLWPAVVGSQLAANTRLKAFRGGVLRIAVPDRTWRGSLASMEKLILEAVHRFFGDDIGQAIELFEDPQMAGPVPKLPRQRGPAMR